MGAHHLQVRIGVVIMGRARDPTESIKKAVPPVLRGGIVELESESYMGLGRLH
jgi:hypothetical protein